MVSTYSIKEHLDVKKKASQRFEKLATLSRAHTHTRTHSTHTHTHTTHTHTHTHTHKHTHTLLHRRSLAECPDRSLPHAITRHVLRCRRQQRRPQGGRRGEGRGGHEERHRLQAGAGHAEGHGRGGGRRRRVQGRPDRPGAREEGGRAGRDGGGTLCGEVSRVR